MNAIPVSYKDPAWTRLSGLAEAKAGLPTGLLDAIVNKGERSNADQVSEAGARTPYQIIPEVRNAVLKKHGIDAYLSPENAAEVAALLLKESLQRNKGDVTAAVAEYHGGTDRSNWGPRTRAYVARVVGQELATQGPTSAPAIPNVSDGQSTFQRVMAGRQAAERTKEVGSIASVYDAYSTGKMSRGEAAEFEKDVKSGAVILPRGTSLKGQPAPTVATAPATPMMLPQEVTEAYINGRMGEQERFELESDIKAGIVALPPSNVSRIPGGPTAPASQPVIPPAQDTGPTIGERLIGAGETALSVGTGMTGGAVGMIGGTVKGMAQSVLDGTFGTQQAANMVEKAAMSGAEALTYAPRTPEGQRQADVVGQALQQVVPVFPLSAEAVLAGQAAKAAQPAARVAGQMAATKLRETAAPVVAKVQSMVPPGKPQTGPAMSTPAGGSTGTAGSVGAAGTPQELMRRQAAADLPVPVELTKGQATRSFEQQRFEQEAAKNPELGQPLRERMVEQHRAVRQSFDAWIDQTGAQAPDLRSIGTSVDTALTKQMKVEKDQVRIAYKDAEKAGELAAPVALSDVVDVLNNSRPAESTAPILVAARQEIMRLGGAAIDEKTGALVMKDMTLNNAEQLRKFINKNAGDDPTNIKYARDLKEAIDQGTAEAGGPEYARARGLRTRFAERFEDRAVIADLVNMKRGSSDRRVALEDVADRIINHGSLDDVRFARQILQTSGAEGRQAWKDVQGGVLQHIRDQATKNVARDVSGAEMISPAKLDAALRQLDSSGKLDFLFGKKGAEQLRTVNDLAKVMFTAPPGTINTSNTASVLLAAMDMAMSGTAGLPLPVASGIRMMTKHVKDRKLRAKIQDALGK
jgi:hypothetical protein